MTRNLRVAIAGLVAAAVVTGAAGAATVANGDFESGDLAGWTVSNLGSGDWFNYTGMVAPLSGHAIAAPPQGTRAATSAQTGPGSHILYQDVALEADHDHMLSFVLYYANWAGAFFSPGTLDPFLGQANQQYRVDIVKPTAPVDSLAAGDVLLNVFATSPGDSLTLAPTPISADLSQFEGQTVRIRFAQVDNQLFFQGSVDAVAIASVPRNKPPDCSAAEAKPAFLWPPNHKLEPIGIRGVTDPEGDAVRILITGIRQDEPTEARGDGSSGPDGAGVGEAVALVRAERSGTGDGRVYHIAFSGFDAEGARCAGNVRVGVPESKGGTVVDGGRLYDSTR
jgi:hypothetical protein